MVPAGVLLGSRAGEHPPLTDRGTAAEAAHLHRWRKVSEKLLIRGGQRSSQPPGGLAVALVLLSAFHSPCLLGLGSLCLGVRLSGATCRREPACQNQTLLRDGVWTRLTWVPRRLYALTRAQLLCSALLICRSDRLLEPDRSCR